MKDTLIVRDNVVVDVWDGGKHVKTYRSHNTWKPDGLRALRDLSLIHIFSGSLGTRTVATFSTVDHPPFATTVEVGQVVEIRDETGSLIFAGTIDSIDEEIDPAETVRFKRVACVDYNQIADRHLVAYVYQPDDLTPTLYAGDVIKDIVSRFFVFGGVTEGIDTSNVEDGPEIEKFVFNYVPASQAFDDIADLTGYVWYIDYEKKLYFTPRDKYEAPICLLYTSRCV